MNGISAFRMLVVEDDYEVRLGLHDFFELQGFCVSVAKDGEQALRMMQQPPGFDIVLLDLMLPKQNGFDVLRAVRAAGLDLPVLMLTASGEEESILKGFDLGAADYVIKPFHADLLLARVRAILRRTRPPASAPAAVFHFGDLEVNLSTCVVQRGAEQVHLTRHECDLLRYLLENRGAPVSRTMLLRDVWGISEDIATRTVDRHMATLRKKIEPDPAHPVFIETVYGRGYRLAQ